MDTGYEPSYIRLYDTGKIREIADKLWQMYFPCRLCPRSCGADRSSGKKGACGADDRLRIAGYMLHRGEEPPISGRTGSGTIFFSNCPLKCVFCQNYSFSQLGEGKVYTVEELAGIMLSLQDMGAHNINLVTPEHYLPHIVLALDTAIGKGLNIPIVYNTSAYVRADVLRIIEGIVDVYLPDMKYASSSWASRLSSAPDYPDISRKAVIEMFRQRGRYVFDSKEGVILSGVIIRHLVLPDDASGSFDTLSWIKREIGKDVFISLMSQYMPVFKANKIEGVNRRITRQEYNKVQEWAVSLGLDKGWWQEDYGLDDMLGERIKQEFMK